MSLCVVWAGGKAPPYVKTYRKLELPMGTPQGGGQRDGGLFEAFGADTGPAD